MFRRILRAERSQRLERGRTRERERALLEQISSLENRLDVIETRQVLAISSKADRMQRDLELESNPLQCVATGVEKGRMEAVEEFLLARPVDQIRGVEFDRLKGVLRVTYQPKRG